MDPSSPSSPIVKKVEDDAKDEKRDIKPIVKTLNRVPRACNACRKQKMRCEGAENPPCRRCKNAGMDCLFEKPSREASLTGEAGLERIRALESHVADIRQTQSTMCSNIQEILNYIRTSGLPARSPSAYPPVFNHSPPNMNSPAMSTPTAAHQQVNEIHHPSPPVGPNGGPHQILHPPASRPSRGSIPNAYPLSGQLPPTSDIPPPHGPQTPLHHFNQLPPSYPANQSTANTTLPPFSSIQSGISQQQPSGNGAPSSRLKHHDHQHIHRYASGSKRQVPTSSTVTSADSSDVEDDDNGELPASGLVAPWEVLRGLADVAVQRAAKENGDEPPSRTRTPSPDRSRPLKRRKTHHSQPPTSYPDVITRKVISEEDARELFKIFYDGCSTFLPIFDSKTDTYEALHDRSPFAVDAICMVAARVRDGGSKPSLIHLKLLEEVQNIARATLFAPVLSPEAVQAMVLISGWSDNGWLSGGHAVRMAMELSMHQAWPKLRKKINANKVNNDEDRELVIAARTWFCLYLFEHQLSYGTGRPAVMKDDESVQDCHLLLRHPLMIDDDMRLVSTVELIKIRERIHNAMSPLEGSVKSDHLDELRRADHDFDEWYRVWDGAFSEHWPDAAFYRQSLQIQKLHAQLFHNATGLRGINGPEDVQRMPPAQRDLAIRSIEIAQKGLDITINSPSYREGMKYAVHYTHVTATFAASFLLRLARLFPNDCNIDVIRDQVQHLSVLMSAIPGKRYALTLQLMLKRSTKRAQTSMSRSPESIRESQRMVPMPMSHQSNVGSMPPPPIPRNAEPTSPTYEMPFAGPPSNHGIHGQNLHPPGPVNMAHHPHHQHQGFLDPSKAMDPNWWERTYEMAPPEQVPVWLSDHSLGGASFSQHGMDAFLLPNDYLPAQPQIW
ncbi:hypothetical protein FA15DRAFT_662869 [Coprinopsis marcescibilis]|uniref:Zn(2)-C6 fungal-type domain-containing protein n=1 Tax=Coprinopsis marcescibilis TaxID=230819 RepID=A0A5C3LCM3_COPMA|nr:hypothetical protein FA15DRAFT_662869 [Coprinopsis marcescibilis]